MRVTTGMIFDSGLASIQKQNSRLLDTQEQVATGRRILRPSDDPVASARALEVSQSKSVNSLYAANQGYANDALKLVDSKLDAATDIVTYVRTRAVESGNGTYSSREQAAIGADITQQFDALLGIANSQDSTGDFVFGGYRSNAMPFGGSLAAGVQYQGDQGPARCRSRPPATCRSPAPARRSSTPSAPAGLGLRAQRRRNAGSALVSGLSLSGYNDHNYVVEVGAGPSYQVFDTTTDPNRASPIAPTVTTSGSDTTLAFGSVSLSLSGTPAAATSSASPRWPAPSTCWATSSRPSIPATRRPPVSAATRPSPAWTQPRRASPGSARASARGWSRWKPSRTSTAAWTCSTRKPCRACRTWITPKR
jgi:flagellar hook-associated protein 3 FlgL